jgi:DNA-binding PadR family transcriptional regulator
MTGGPARPAEARAARAGLSNTAAAVLGLVRLGARSGYEVRRATERSVRFFWALGPPQIYAELKRLEAGGLIDGRDDARGGRARRAFAATPAGEEALRAWVAGAGAGPLELRDPELLRLFFADAVDRDAALARVDVMRRRSQEALEHFEREITPAAVRARETGAVFPGHVAAFGRELHEFIVGWCDRLSAAIAAEAGGT